MPRVMLGVFELLFATSVMAQMPLPATDVYATDIRTTVQADAGTVVFETTEERRSDELQGERGGYGHLATIPLRGLVPGIYVLRTEARSRLAPDAPVFRQVLFRIHDPASQ